MHSHHLKLNLSKSDVLFFHHSSSPSADLSISIPLESTTLSSFMVWQLPKQEKQISTDSRSPWKKPPSEEEIRKALTAQYRSTYKTDYLGIPQGVELSYFVVSEYMGSSTSRYGSNTQHRVPAKGVVPSVTYEHIKIQENGKQLTTYDRHFGGQKEDISTVLNSLQPQELHHFLQNVPEKGI
ncbi:TEX26 protein, partial [Amia calva]|nr:TEX26 protein [Amia calva]